MILNLPKWYRKASISDVKEEILEKRSKSIIRILKIKDKAWFFDCIRMCLNKTTVNPDFAHDLYMEFTSEDAMFIEDESDNELTILAGALICESITADGVNSIEIALAYITAYFGIKPENVSNIDIIIIAKKFISESSFKKRENPDLTISPLKYPAVKEDSTSIENFNVLAKTLNSYLKAFEKNFDAERNAMQNRILVLEEESNIHWWIFRAYSSTKRIPLKELSGPEASILIAADLTKMINILPPPENTKNFLEISLKNTGSDQVNHDIETYVEAMVRELSAFLVSAEDIYGNLTPLVYGALRAKEFGDGWQAAFEKNTDLKKDMEISSIEAAEQLLLEMLLHENYNI